NSDKSKGLMDFELTEYYVDDPRDCQGGSPSKRTSGWWDKVQAALDLQLEILRLPVDVGVRFKEPIVLKNSQVDKFASELIRFAQQFCPEHHLGRSSHRAFSVGTYPLLHEFVEQISLVRFDGLAFLGWHCSNVAAAFVGVVLRHLRNHILLKSAKNFTWTPGAVKCLLVYASGDTASSRAGPTLPDPAIWEDNDLVAASKASVFDCIYFWERVRKWHRKLK